MTILGKILVFLNLAFSFLTGALIVTVFVTRTNWKAGFEDMRKSYDVSEANARAYRDEVDDVRKQVRLAQEALAAEKADHQKDLTARDAQIAAAHRALDEEQAKSKAASTLASATTEEARRRQTEVENFQKQLADSETRRVSAETRAKNSQNEAVAARIEAHAEHERNLQLRETNEQLAKEVERARMTGAGATGVSQALKPPPEDVKGLVTESDPRTGLVTISLGSDSGIQPGHTLEVFRYEPRPQYVGTISIVDAQFHQAVGRIVPPLAPGAGPIRKGDRVATRLGGLTSNRNR